MGHPRISVLTATKNVQDTLPGLYESLERQSYREFEWVVVDGMSTDLTQALLQGYAAKQSWVRFVSESDFGIYDALNKAIALSTADYYVVIGGDDVFADDAMQNFAAQLERGDPDVILARVRKSGRTIGGYFPERGWIGHSKAFPGSHSVGMLFKKQLHARFGMYSKRFPLLADGYFLKQLLRANASFVEAGFIAGTFSDTGISTLSKLQTLAEAWQIQMLTERQSLVQTLLFLGKIMYRYAAVAAEMRQTALRWRK